MASTQAEPVGGARDPRESQLGLDLAPSMSLNYDNSHHLNGEEVLPRGRAEISANPFRRDTPQHPESERAAAIAVTG